MSEYKDLSCPECTGIVNDYGFCEDCSFDVEQNLQETNEVWDELLP